MSLSVSQQGSTATITLDRPEKHNAFDDVLILELIKAFNAMGSDPVVRVIVLAASGRHFSAGADLSWMRRMADMDQQQNRDDARALAALMRTIDEAKKPVVCCVQGAAYGGALGLITACDIAIASEDARFCLSEVRLGILPAVISPYVVRAMGARQAQRFFMTAEVIDAPTALRLGIVHEVVSPDDLSSRLIEVIDTLLMGAPQAQLRSRMLINQVANKPIDEGLTTWTAELIAELRTSDEGREGLDAFLQKRLPSWQQPRSGDA